jgi:lysophospholipase L1-like esterase
MARHGATMVGGNLRNLLAEGDSITTNDIAVSYASLYHADNPLLPFHNTAVSASIISNLTSRATSDDALKVSGAYNVLSVLIGANDMAGGSAATYLSNLATYLDARRAAGWIVALCTVLPRNEASAAGFEAKRQTANATLRTWPGTHCDAIVDYDTTTMGTYASCLDASLFGDGLHPTAAGHLLLEPAYAPVITGMRAGKVLPPAISIAPGTYNNDQSVTIACSTSGASIYYTTDGSTPTASSTAYSGSFTLAATSTLKVIAIKSGMADSIVTSCTTTFQVATPTFSPVAGSYGSSQTVTISCATTGVSMYYTTDGSTPTTGSTAYSAPLTVAASETIKVLAVKTGYTSATASAAYSIATFVAATGGTVTTDGDYKVHTFTSGDTFTVTAGGNVQYLVVGGGGGGGSFVGGGGGAGGLLANATDDYPVTAQAYSITVGAGGNGAATTDSAATAGGDSVFDTFTATGGGRGASGNTSVTAAGNGGSGGGGSFHSTGAGTGTSGQGHNGGTSSGSTDSGGGGGASAAGGNGATGTQGGNGGAGTSNSITGSAVTYAGGGGGSANGNKGLGGSGGGGDGSANGGTAVAGTANKGGGGGSGYLNAGAAGGSGVVIIRYKFQ